VNEKKNPPDQLSIVDLARDLRAVYPTIPAVLPESERILFTSPPCIGFSKPAHETIEGEIISRTETRITSIYTRHEVGELHIDVIGAEAFRRALDTMQRNIAAATTEGLSGFTIIDGTGHELTPEEKARGVGDNRLLGILKGGNLT
jgi:hypothetical protein